jgi:hypothetical protein
VNSLFLDLLWPRISGLMSAVTTGSASEKRRLFRIGRIILLMLTINKAAGTSRLVHKS